MKKNFTIYPLVISPKDFKLDAKCFANKTTIDDVINNEIVIDWHDEKIPYSIVTDSVNYNKKIILGRFLKLKKGAISQISPDKQNKLKEEVVANKPGEYLLEPAYFLLDYSNNIILGQYTTDSINVLSSRPTEVLKNILIKCNNISADIELSLIPTDELIKAILEKQPLINNYKFKLSKINLEFARKYLGLSDSTIAYLLGHGTVEINLSMKFEYGKVAFTQKILDNLRKTFIKGDKHSKSIKIDTENGSFDIIKENYIYYRFVKEIDISKEMDDSYYRNFMNEVYKEIEKILYNNLDTILNSIKLNKTIYDFDNQSLSED